MSQVSDVTHWIRTAKQEKNNRNLANYMAFALSECSEMIKEIDDPHPKALAHLMEQLSVEIRNGEFDNAIAKANKAKLADAGFDTAWCSIGVMHMLGCAQEIWNEGSSSNYSKFNQDGTASLTENGKVIKGPNFKEPDFSKYVGGK